MMKKKLHLLLVVLVFVFVLAFHVNPAYASEFPTETTETTETTEEVYRVTITFKSNGGSGSMSNLTVESNQPAVLPANRFKKTNFQFAGWATKANGSGKTYADKADVSGLATAENDGSNIILYAQWKPKQPKIKSVKSPTPSYIKVTFAKNNLVSGYEIQYSTSQKFSKSKTKTVKAAKDATSAKLLEVIPNKKYYVRMRSYKTTKGVSQYSDWSKTLSVKVKNGKTVANTKYDVAIEADVKLKGSGSGYHAKLVMGNATSAVSFGMQYDVGAANPYGSRNMALIENVTNNGPGGQEYVRPRDYEFELDKPYHLMMTVDSKGRGEVYVNYEKIGSFYQPNIKTSELSYVAIEACGRLSGDKVDAEFSDVKCKLGKNADILVLGNNLDWREDRRNAGLKYKFNKKDNIIRLYGTIKNVGGDWDSNFAGVSEVLLFREKSNY